MKKSIQKPENWQDFETLCKKLWGEIWEIPMKVKKNGRSGQPQCGVDIYGIPKGEISYWGIQCKGKDSYTDAKLTKKEIDIEVEKAKFFKPGIAVFIFATTMNKDVEIEEYIRLKDIESRRSGGFEILVYCWEDIADLIEENRDTFNYYVGGHQHKVKHGFEIYLNDYKLRIEVNPKCVRTIRRYRLKKRKAIDTFSQDDSLSMKYPWAKDWSRFEPPKIFSINLEKINEAICSFEIIMANVGAVVIEDWRVQLEFLGDFEEIFDQLGTGPMGMIDIGFLKHKRTYVDENFITYTPKENEPLIQKDNRYFEAYVIPKCKEYTIPIRWQILARDYDMNGEIYIDVKPIYEDRYEYIDVYEESEMQEDEVISITAKKNYEE